MNNEMIRKIPSTPITKRNVASSKIVRLWSKKFCLIPVGMLSDYMYGSFSGREDL